MPDESKPLHREIEELLREMASPAPAAEAPAGAPRGPSGAVATIDALKDVTLDVRVELGRARLTIEEVLRLARGSVVELDRLAGEPVDLFVNDRRVARGVLVAAEDQLAVRVTEILNFPPTAEK